MATLNIDGKEYDTEQLSEAAREQLASIQLVDQKLAQLQQEAAILQTARNAYAKPFRQNCLKKADSAFTHRGPLALGVWQGSLQNGYGSGGRV